MNQGSENFLTKLYDDGRLEYTELERDNYISDMNKVFFNNTNFCYKCHELANAILNSNDVINMDLIREFKYIVWWVEWKYYKLAKELDSAIRNVKVHTDMYAQFIYLLGVVNTFFGLAQHQFLSPYSAVYHTNKHFLELAAVHEKITAVHGVSLTPECTCKQPLTQNFIQSSKNLNVTPQIIKHMGNSLNSKLTELLVERELNTCVQFYLITVANFVFDEDLYEPKETAKANGYFTDPETYIAAHSLIKGVKRNYDGRVRTIMKNVKK